MTTYCVGDVADVVVLDITTAVIGEYASVRIIETDGDDILVSDAKGNTAWVTHDHLQRVED